MTACTSLPDIDFRLIRPYGSPPSKADAFEELVSLLMRDGLIDWPEGTAFHRFGNPDGGREGRGVLPDGDVWAWQAKYLFEFGTAEVNQVSDSVSRALEAEPNLKRFYVALPYDLPAGDVTGAKRQLKSAFTKWTEKTAEWQALAVARGMTVEFIYLGAHDFVTELTKTKQAGRLHYWFSTNSLTQEFFQQRLADAVSKAGRRYTPEVHVDVESVQVLEGLGRTDSYVHKVRVALGGLREVRVARWLPPENDGAAFSDSLESIQEALTTAELALQQFLEALAGHGPLPEIREEIRGVESALAVVEALLRERHLRESSHYINGAASLHSKIHEAWEAYGAALALLNSPETLAARDGRVLMTGRAGVGKTHLFCDVASRRVADGLPTVIVLGQDFDSRTLLPQIGELSQINGSLDEALAVLDAAGEAAGHYALLMIDAINESANAGRWVDDLRVLQGAVNRHPNVALAVSCRTEFTTHVVGDPSDFPRVEHRGFAEATSKAVDRYTSEYNLERLTFPVLNPEYGNPLFLKLACEALATLGQNRFVLGTAGLTTVCSAFIEAVNKRLAAPDRCDYDESSNLVQKVVRAIAELGPGPYSRDATRAITESLLPGRTWSKSLLLGLLREGVLTDISDGQVAFGYQRLSDVFRAELLAENEVGLSTWYDDLGGKRWSERGTLGALAVITPETIGMEIVDLFKDADTGETDEVVIDAFVESISLRSPDHTNERTNQVVEQLVAYPEWTRRIWEQLVRVACVPGHPLNATWTHQLLLSRPRAERDLTWSEWLVGSTAHDEGYDDENAVRVLLGWGWPADGDTKATSLPDDVARLATLILGWMLTTPDRRVRDHATKALVSVGERGTDGFAAGMREFVDCNDPFVIERLAGAACGVALRSAEGTVMTAVADAALDMVSTGWPKNLLTRDYLRHLSEIARAHGWDGPTWMPPYGTRWPGKALSYEQIEAMDSGPEYQYGTIWGSVHGQFGDFGRYIIQPALDHFDVPNHKELRRLVERTIFTRVLELGWTPDAFNNIDSRRRGRHDGPVERYGKKYQWIALYEVLGLLADNFQLKEPWSESEPFPYAYAEQLVYRDIDPTVLVRGSALERGDGVWFASAGATFPDEVVEEYPKDLDGIPDPLDLIAATSPDGGEWLSLMRHASWAQDLPPEIAALKAPTLSVWMQIRGYLVSSSDCTTLRSWAEGQDWDGRWMAENGEVHSRLLARAPQVPEWERADGNADPRSLGDRVLPAELFQPAAWYGGTGSSRYASDAKEPTGFVPSRMLFDLLHLRPGRDFRWEDEAGLAVTDPSAGLGEHSTLLLRRELAAKLSGAGYGLLWTVLLNKQRNDHGYNRSNGKYRWISASASYLMLGNTVELISANAWLCRSVPGGDPKQVPWNVRRTG